MPSMTTKQPRQFVRSVPLPISSQKGIPIQARSQEIYNPRIPTRDEVRHINYRRRQSQLTQQGFRSVNYKPYQGIGDPFYLDQKKLILHALGQWQEGEDLGESSSAESSDEDENQLSNKTNIHMTSRNFGDRKSRKGLNTLSKEVSHGRDMIRSVKLGHGLFQLLQHENEQRTEAKQKELQQKRERMWNEWQPPKSEDDSDSDLTDDDEINTDVDLKNFMTTSYIMEPAEDDTEGGGTTFLTQPVEAKPPEARSVVFRDIQSSTTTNQATDIGKSTISVNISSARTGAKKKGTPARPFTPQHSNIGADYNRATTKEQREALFRQLCTLYWLLEAMNCSDPAIMNPITTCWNLSDIGGSKTSVFAKQQKDKAETNWKRFTTNQALRTNDRPKLVRRKASMSLTVPDVVEPLATIELDPIKPAKEVRLMPHMKRYSAARQGHIKSGIRRGSQMQRGSVSSTPSGSQSQLNLSGSGSVLGAPPGGIGSLRRVDHAAIPEDEESASMLEQEEEYTKERKKSIEDRSELLDGYKPEEGQPLGESGVSRSELSASRRNSARSRMPDDFGIPQKRKSSASPKRSVTTVVDTPQKHLQARILENINRSEADPRLHKLANPTEKRSSSSLRAEYNVRPKSTAEVIQYQLTLPSTRLGILPVQLRSDFNEVTDEKAHTLHDTLEAVDRDRMRKLRGMFFKVPTRTSLHKALRQMRPKMTNPDDDKDKRRRSSMHQQWYIDLTNTIPDEVRQDWFFEKILDKLSRYGMVEASKQSSFKFRRVLKALRDWEVCSPDICAAIEFCREKIVEMAVEEYEEWFIEAFPTVVRPQTAPPAIKGSNHDNRPTTGRVRKTGPKSAPPGVRIKVH